VVSFTEGSEREITDERAPDVPLNDGKPSWRFLDTNVNPPDGVQDARAQPCALPFVPQCRLEHVLLGFGRTVRVFIGREHA
jgi:hypothetical protein